METTPALKLDKKKKNEKIKTISIRNLDPEERKKWAIKMNERKKEMKELKALKTLKENEKKQQDVNLEMMETIEEPKSIPSQAPPPCQTASTSTPPPQAAAAASAAPVATPTQSETAKLSIHDSLDDLIKKIQDSKQFDAKQLNELRKLQKTKLKIEHKKGQIEHEKELYKQLHYDRIMDKINELVDKKMEDLETRLLTLGELKEDEIEAIVQEDLNSELKSTTTSRKENSIVHQYLKKKFDPLKITKNGSTRSNSNKTSKEEPGKTETVEKSITSPPAVKETNVEQNKVSQKPSFNPEEEFQKRSSLGQSFPFQQQQSNETRYKKNSFVKPLVLDQNSIKSCF